MGLRLLQPESRQTNWVDHKLRWEQVVNQADMGLSILQPESRQTHWVDHKLRWEQVVNQADMGLHGSTTNFCISNQTRTLNQYTT